tara:strand:+ start:580 stop:756 length:177 start_codon:yes stop_codon:yes gene_type:complete
MAEGDLTASTPVLATGIADLKTKVDALNLAAVTDFIAIVPMPESPNQYSVFKIEREAA